jgi:hypothetical protein
MTDRISSFHLDVEQQMQERMQVLVQLSITRIFAKCSQRAATDPKPLALAPSPTVILSPNITVRPQQFKRCRSLPETHSSSGGYSCPYLNL